MEKDTLFTIYDSSVLSHLLDRNSLDNLFSQKTIKEFGFPLLTQYHIFELAGIDTLEQFKYRFKKLLSHSDIYTIETSGQPFQITTILEIEAKNFMDKKYYDFDSLKEHVRTNTKKLTLSYSDELADYYFNFSKEQIRKTNLAASINPFHMNPYLTKPIKDWPMLQKDPNHEQNIRFAVKLFTSYLVTKGIKKTDELTEDFVASIRKYITDCDFSSMEKYIEKMIGSKPDLNRSIKYYTIRNELFNILRSLSSLSIYSDSDLKSIPVEQCYIFNFQQILKGKLEEILTKDEPRKLEFSNTNDVYLSSFSIYEHTVVDKRTEDLILQSKKHISQIVNFTRVNYNNFN